MFRQHLIIILCFGVVALRHVGGKTADHFEKSIFRFFEPQDPRIINGTEARLDASKHQVSVRRRARDGFFFGTGHICGGSLISENLMLSAAHCFLNYNIIPPDGSYRPEEDFIAVMGNLDRFEYNNNTLVFDIKKIVKRIEIFNSESFDNDIVLIVLNGTVPANHPTVKPIILNDMPLKRDTMCQVSGWGNTSLDYLPDKLLTVDVPIIDVDDCREKTEYGSIIHEGMMCAGYLEGEKDACNGDSGGALVCGGLQAGIVSWGSGCGEPLLPGIYTDVNYYKEWILKEAANQNATLPKFATDNGVNGGNGGNDLNCGNDGAAGGDGVNNRDGVASLSCSLVLVSLILVFNYVVSQPK